MTRYILAFLLLAIACHADVDENLPIAKPNPKEVRAAIDKLIAGTDKVNPSVILLCIEKSISVGATTYNDGDIKGCYEFYRATATALVKKFKTEESATPGGAKAIATLRASLASAAKYGDADRQAWAMRYGFDKIVLETTLLRSEAEEHVSTGTRFFGMGNYREAEDAFKTVVALIKELKGPKVESLSLNVRIAAAGLSHSLYAQEKWKESATAIQSALLLMPNWPTYPMDQRVFYRDEAEHGAILKKLVAAVKARPDDADLQFLLGHECFFSDQREKAFSCFRSVLKKNPKHAGALVFQKLDPASELQIKINDWVGKLGADDSKVRDAAEEALEKIGVWAAPALRNALEKSDDPEVALRVRRLLTLLSP